jgi:hypothetical protein
VNKRVPKSHKNLGYNAMYYYANNQIYNDYLYCSKKKLVMRGMKDVYDSYLRRKWA